MKISAICFQVDSFDSSVEVRALIEGQFLSKRVHAERLGYTMGKSTLFCKLLGSSIKLAFDIVPDFPVGKTAWAHGTAFPSPKFPEFYKNLGLPVHFCWEYAFVCLNLDACLEK